MSDDLMRSSRGAKPRRRIRLGGPRRLALSAIVTIAAALPVAMFAASAPVSAASNASIVGTWVVSGGYLGFTITGENLSTGVCVGKTASPLYHLIGCRVTGSKCLFTITEGTSYRSHNVGTVKAKIISGKFNDSNGTIASYTAHRK